MTNEHSLSPRSARRKYKHLVSAVVEANGEWVQVPLDEIGGSTNTTKCSLVHQAAYGRGLSFKTTIVDGFMYVKLRNENDAHCQLKGPCPGLPV